MVAYNIGRRSAELLRLTWDQVDFDEGCIYFEKTKFGPGKAPFFGEMEEYLRRQKELRDHQFPGCNFVFFWYDYRSDKNGEQIVRFDSSWKNAVAAPGEKMKKDGRDPIGLTSTTSAVQHTTKCERPALTDKHAATSWVTKARPWMTATR